MAPMPHFAKTGNAAVALTPLNLGGIPMAPTPAVAAAARGDALEPHARRCARLLGDLGLLGGRDIHDDAALEHLRQAHLEAELFLLVHGGSLSAPDQALRWIVPRPASDRRRAMTDGVTFRMRSTSAAWLPAPSE